MERNTKIVIAGSAVAIGVAGALIWYYYYRKPIAPPTNGTIPAKEGCKSYEDCLPTEQCKDGKCVPLEQWNVPKPPSKPNTPTQLTATSAPNEPIKLSWTAPVQNEAKISGYRVYRLMDYGYYKETEIYSAGNKTAWDDTLRKGKVGQLAKTITYQVSAVSIYTTPLNPEPTALEGDKSNAVTVEIPVPEEYKAITGTAKLTVYKKIVDKYGDIKQRIPIPGVEVTLGNVATPITKKTDAMGVVVFDKLSLNEEGSTSSYPFTLKYYGNEGKGVFNVSKGKPNEVYNIDTLWEIKTPETPLQYASIASFNPFAGVIQPISPNPIVNIVA